jgi:hypothetical protein
MTKEILFVLIIRIILFPKLQDSYRTYKSDTTTIIIWYKSHYQWYSIKVQCNGCCSIKVQCNGCYSIKVQCNGCYSIKVQCNGCYSIKLKWNGCYSIKVQCNGCCMR